MHIVCSSCLYSNIRIFDRTSDERTDGEKKMRRYEIFINGVGSGLDVKETSDGNWIRYKDFEAEVNRVVRKRIIKNKEEVILDRVNERITELNRQYDNREHVIRGDVRKMIKALADDLEGYNSPDLDGNPHITAVRTALGAVIDALKQGVS